MGRSRKYNYSRDRHKYTSRRHRPHKSKDLFSSCSSSSSSSPSRNSLRRIKKQKKHLHKKSNHHHYSKLSSRKQNREDESRRRKKKLSRSRTRTRLQKGRHHQTRHHRISRQKNTHRTKYQSRRRQQLRKTIKHKDQNRLDNKTQYSLLSNSHSQEQKKQNMVRNLKKSCSQYSSQNLSSQSSSSFSSSSSDQSSKSFSNNSISQSVSSLSSKQHSFKTRALSPHSKLFNIEAKRKYHYESQSESSSTSSPKHSYKKKDRKRDAGHYRFKPGERIKNYKIIRHISDGTFGRVVEVLDINTNNVYALKIVRAVQRYVDSAKIETEILEKVQSHQDQRKNTIVRLIETFSYEKNFCMVFERLGISLFSLIKKNNFEGFPLKMVQSFLKQILVSIGFLHDIHLTHTDLKPENILIASTDPLSLENISAHHFYEYPLIKQDISQNSKEQQEQLKQNDQVNSNSSSLHIQHNSQYYNTAYRNQQQKRYISLYLPKNDDIKLIDFGGATWSHDHHSSIINTRQYRSPEVILGGQKWNEASDVWGIGCIAMELITGELYFGTHDDFEHLAMIEKSSGLIPQYMGLKSNNLKMKRIILEDSINNSNSNNQLNQQSDYPYRHSSYTDWLSVCDKQSQRRIRQMKIVKEIIKEGVQGRQELVSLINRCLEIDPVNRITCREALQHQYFNILYAD